MADLSEGVVDRAQSPERQMKAVQQTREPNVSMGGRKEVAAAEGDHRDPQQRSNPNPPRTMVKSVD